MRKGPFAGSSIEMGDASELTARSGQRAPDAASAEETFRSPLCRLQTRKRGAFICSETCVYQQKQYRRSLRGSGLQAGG
jgi:hypothetical protein